MTTTNKLWLEVLISKNNIYYSAGSISIINDTEKTWIIYHAIITGKATYNGTRYACIDELKWDSEDWPYIDGKSPSNERKVGPIILTDVDTSLEKSNILTDIDTSFEKSDIFTDVDTSFEKSNLILHLKNLIFLQMLILHLKVFIKMILIKVNIFIIIILLLLKL